MMWQVILDANIIRENWLLDGPSVSVLKKFIECFYIHSLTIPTLRVDASAI